MLKKKVHEKYWGKKFGKKKLREMGSILGPLICRACYFGVYKKKDSFTWNILSLHVNEVGAQIIKTP